ncbi:MAG TPA: protein kinase [Kofleriaceae bacterium]|nr:protein kinase [Kofleriaceae bacterium]
MREHVVVAGRYRIERKLAAGGFGAIYAATDLVMGREVALKVLHRELAHDDLVVARFRREAEALARLRDPHTVTMYDVGADADGTPFIVLELLRGETLYQQFMTHGVLPWRRMATIARGVCSSLREAHEAGIIHRDLKPANIHLEVTALQQDHVKVLDFGIAKMVDATDHAALPDLTLAGQMIGTFDYMPPEQLIGGRCSGQTDVFALAVMIYEMIAGELPFGPAPGPAGRLMTMLSTTPVPLGDRAPGGVPPQLADIVMRALSREPEDRPSMEELDDVLVRLLEETSVRVRVLTDDVANEISSLIDEVLSESTAANANAEMASDDDGTFPEDDADTWVGEPPQTTTIGHAPTRPPSAPPVAPSDVASLMKPLGKKQLPLRAPDFQAEGTGRQPPVRDVLGTPAPELLGRARTESDRTQTSASSSRTESDRTPSSASSSNRPANDQARFAIGSATEIEKAHLMTPTARRVTPAHMPPPPPRRTPPQGAAIVGGHRVTPSQDPVNGGAYRNTPSQDPVNPGGHRNTPSQPVAATTDSQAQTAQTARQPARGAVDPLAQTLSPGAQIKAAPSSGVSRIDAPSSGASRIEARAGSPNHLHIDARSTDSQARSADSQAQTARQPRRVLTPPSGRATTGSARAEIERLASRPQMPVVRITPPQGNARDSLMPPPHRMWMGRPTPSEQALPPAPHLTPSGALPSLPTRMATGTSPIVNQTRRISLVRVAVWTIALFGVGFAAALGIGAL